MSEETLTDDQRARLREVLKARFVDLREHIRQALLRSDDESYIELAGQVHDEEDEALADLLVDLNLAQIDRQLRELREVDAALMRLARSGYGECEDCGEAVPFQRLLAYPTARRCIRCQSRHEQRFAQKDDRGTGKL